jgi:hypothetical protein
MANNSKRIVNVENDSTDPLKIPDAPDYPVSTPNYGGGYAVYSQAPAPAEAVDPAASVAAVPSGTVAGEDSPLFSPDPVADGEDFPDGGAPADGEDFPDGPFVPADGEDEPDDAAAPADGEDFPDDPAEPADGEDAPLTTPDPVLDDNGIPIFTPAPTAGGGSDAEAVEEVVITLTSTTTIYTTSFS